MSGKSDIETVIKATPEAVAREGAQRFVHLAQKAIAKQGAFSVALSGGNTPRLAFNMLTTPPFRDEIDWGNVHFFWGDERFVPPEDPESNFQMAQAILLSQVDVPQQHIYRIPTLNVTPVEAATQYSQRLTAFFDSLLPRFDLVLLGLGPDGHTASLFPECVNEANTERASVVVVKNAPKPPPVRLSLTLESINHAANIVFLVTGHDKAQIVQKVLQPRKPGEKRLPAQRVQPTDGHLVWLLDEAAAQKLHR